MTVQTVPYRCPSCQRTAAVEFEGIPPTQAELEDLDPCPWCSAGWGNPDDDELFVVRTDSPGWQDR
jgi:uncharacterized protein CbrC (UPF0167 family)